LPIVPKFLRHDLFLGTFNKAKCFLSRYFCFMNLSPQSRVWIYLSSRQFSDEEVSKLNSLLSEFCNEWAAHGINLVAEGKVLFQRFVVLTVDETKAGASGCSIDSSVHFIQSLEREFNTQLFNRALVPLKDGNDVRVLPLNEVKNLLQEGKLSEEMYLFNTLVQTKEQLDHRFIIPLKDSWLSRFIPQTIDDSEK